LDKAEKERGESDLSEEAFAVSFYLTGKGVAGAEDIAREMSATFEENPHWRDSQEQEATLRRSLYKALMKTEKQRMVELVNGLLELLRKASS
jgi:hypothetical protein